MVISGESHDWARKCSPGVFLFVCMRAGRWGHMIANDEEQKPYRSTIKSGQIRIANGNGQYGGRGTLENYARTM